MAGVMLNLLVLVPLLFWAIPRFGVIGAAWAILGAALIQVPINYLILLRLLRARWRDLGATLWRPAAASFIMATVIKTVEAHWSSPAGPALELAMYIPLGAVAYIGTVALLWLLAGSPEGGEMAVVRALGGRFIKAANT